MAKSNTQFSVNSRGDFLFSVYFILFFNVSFDHSQCNITF